LFCSYVNLENARDRYSNFSTSLIKTRLVLSLHDFQKCRRSWLEFQRFLLIEDCDLKFHTSLIKRWLLLSLHDFWKCRRSWYKSWHFLLAFSRFFVWQINICREIWQFQQIINWCRTKLGTTILLIQFLQYFFKFDTWGAK